MRFAFQRAACAALAAAVFLTAAFAADTVPVAAEAENVPFAFASIDDVKESFISYCVPSGSAIESTDSDGNPLYAPCPAELAWTAENGVLTRYGEGSYAGGASGRNGAAVLYFKERYENFCVEFDYRVTATSGWRWAGLGFGAQEIGKNYTNDGYFAYVEKEGSVRMYHAATSAPYLSSTAHSDYTAALGAGQWIHARFCVVNGLLTLEFRYSDAAGAPAVISVEKQLSDYTGGYVYLHSFTQGMNFRNLSIAEYKTVSAVYADARYTAQTGVCAEDALPQSLAVSFTDGTAGEVPVVWETPADFGSDSAGLYRVSGSLSAGDAKILIPEPYQTVETYLEVCDYNPEYTAACYFTDSGDIADTFFCYTYPNDVAFGAKDEAGNSLHQEIDPGLAWRVNPENYGLERYGTGSCSGGSGTNGASLLYFKEQYTDFELRVEYRFSSTDHKNSWRWMGVGFGADEPGDTYRTDSYFAVVEKEGAVRLHMKSEDGTLLAKINSPQNEEYARQVSSELASNTDVWHSMTVRVVCGDCYISYDGGPEYSASLPLYAAGYVYLFSNTQYMQLRNLRITRFLTGDTEHTIEVWPEEYSVESYTSSGVVGMEKSSDRFSFQTVVNGQRLSLSVAFPADGGIRVFGERSGFFEPGAYREIAYETVPDGIRLSASDETAVFRSSGAEWELVTLKDGAESAALSSENLFFGYKDGEIARIKYCFPIADGELLYGLGERFNAVNQNGYTVTLWNHDPTYHTAGETGDKTDSYANVPVLHSTDGYTLFFNSTYYAEADIGYTDETQYSFDFNGDILDLFIWNGTPTENMQGYTALTGKAWIPPEWAFRYWAGSGSTAYREAGGEACEEYTLSVLQGMVDGYSSMGIVPAALYGEGDYINYSSSTFSLLAYNGIRALSWNRCSTSYKNMVSKLSCPLYELPLIRVASERFKYFGNPTYAYIDYTNPLSVTLVKELYREKVQQGLHGLMIDMGEYIGEDTAFSNGKTGDEMHNLYSYYYAKRMNEGMTELIGNDFVLFERSGCAGSWQYSASFGGDQAAKWYGLRQQLNALLTASASGFSVWGGDIGGLHGRPTDELYMRWVQFAAFSPLMREHGNTADDGMPWTYGEQAAENFKSYYNLRESLLGHIYSSALQSGRTGVPMVLTMAMAYPQDAQLSQMEDQYLFCGNLLVAPVLEEGVTAREVVLPEGYWYDLWSGKRVSGAAAVTADAPADTIPVYLKSGSVTPLQLSSELSLTEPGDRQVLLITPPEKEEEVTVSTDAADREYRLSITGERSFTLEKDAADGCATLIVYGFQATSVNAGGTELSCSDGVSPGFYIRGENTVILLPDSRVTAVEIYGAGVLRRNNITGIDLLSDVDLDSFVCYSVTGDTRIEAYDENGVSLFRKTQPSEIWSVPFPGVLERSSGSAYTSTGSRTGASALYLGGSYTDFELEFSYCYNGVSGSWRWISVGFGAEKPGDSYYDSGYLALLEQEGTLKLLGDAVNRSITTYRLSNTVQEGYPDLQTWYTFRLRVVGDTATLWFADTPYSYRLPDYNGGLIYLHCFTNGIQFRDIRIADLSGTAAQEGDRFEITVSPSLSGGSLVAGKNAATAGTAVTVSAAPEDGFLLPLSGITLSGYGSDGMTVQKLLPDSSGVCTFVMPAYPVVLSVDYYRPYDANLDGLCDVRDLVRLKRYLAAGRVFLNENAADADRNGWIDSLDAVFFRKRLLSNLN